MNLDDVRRTNMTNQDITVYKFSDLLGVLPFGRTKLQRLCQEGILPVVKVGKTYITTQQQLECWFMENEGHEIK